MEVVKMGRHPRDDPFKGTCPGCKSIVKAIRSELTIQDDREGEFGRGKCPVCEWDMVFYPVTGKEDE